MHRAGLANDVAPLTELLFVWDGRPTYPTRGYKQLLPHKPNSVTQPLPNLPYQKLDFGCLEDGNDLRP
jgi:hypothetical protein